MNKETNAENMHVSQHNSNEMLCAVLSQDDLLQIGFEKLPHFTVNNAMIFQLGRNRHLSVGDVGTPNEMLFICQSDENDYRKITNLICVANKC